MNDSSKKNIVCGFSFRMIRKIMQMKEGNIHHDHITVIVALFV